MLQLFNKTNGKATVEKNSPELQDPVTEFLLKMLKKRLADVGGNAGSNSSSNGGGNVTSVNGGDAGALSGDGGINP